MDSYVRFEEEPSDTASENRRRQSKKLKRSAFFLLLMIIAMTYIFMLGSFYNFYYPYTYDEVFKKVEISSEYDLKHMNRLLPLVKVKFADKNIELKHRVLPQTNEKNHLESDDGCIFGDWFKKIKLIFKAITTRDFIYYESKDDSIMKIKQEFNNYKFNISKVSLKQDPVQCYNFSVRSHGKRVNKRDDEIEVCFNLDGNSWFGGHE
jgi:hypothetical protein